MKLEYVIGGVVGLMVLSGLAVYLQNAKRDGAMMQKTGSTSQASSTDTTMPSKEELLTDAMKARKYQKAPELGGIAGYLNTDGKPITISQFKGKSVVLIDFWTYSCINCQRTLPYVTAWYGKYKDQGLVIIGVHTPEFSFEKNQQNVADALKRFGITYPVVLDNTYGTWNNFSNQFWPRKYLIDIDGYIVYDHAGEGNYDETETAIQKALQERAARLHMGDSMVPNDMIHPAGVMEVNNAMVGSPETYFGSARNEYLQNGTKGTEDSQRLILPQSPSLNSLYLGGTWNFTPEYAEGSVGSDILYHFSSKSVYFVGASKDGADLDITLDGKPVVIGAGADVKNSSMHVKEDRLYKVIEASGYGDHVLKIHVRAGVLEAFTFTFG